MSRIKTQDAELFFQNLLTGPKLTCYLYPLESLETCWKRQSQGRLSGRQDEVPVRVYFDCWNGMAPCPAATSASGEGVLPVEKHWSLPLSPSSPPPPPHPLSTPCSSSLLEFTPQDAPDTHKTHFPGSIPSLEPPGQDQVASIGALPCSLTPQSRPKTHPLCRLPIAPAFLVAPLTFQSCPETSQSSENPTASASHPSQQRGLAAAPVPQAHPRRQDWQHPWFPFKHIRVHIWKHPPSQNPPGWHCSINCSSYPSLLLPAKTRSPPPPSAPVNIISCCS